MVLRRCPFNYLLCHHAKKERGWVQRGPLVVSEAATRMAPSLPRHLCTHSEEQHQKTFAELQHLEPRSLYAEPQLQPPTKLLQQANLDTSAPSFPPANPTQWPVEDSASRSVRSPAPTAMTPQPTNCHVRHRPVFDVKKPARKPAGALVKIRGRIMTAERSGRAPLTAWKYTGRKYPVQKSIMAWKKLVAYPPTAVRLRKSLGGIVLLSVGSHGPASKAAKATRPRHPSTSGTMVRRLLAKMSH
jgi:hypothetical protein